MSPLERLSCHGSLNSVVLLLQHFWCVFWVTVAVYWDVTGAQALHGPPQACGAGSTEPGWGCWWSASLQFKHGSHLCELNVSHFDKLMFCNQWSSCRSPDLVAYHLLHQWLKRSNKNRFWSLPIIRWLKIWSVQELQALVPFHLYLLLSFSVIDKEFLWIFQMHSVTDRLLNRSRPGGFHRPKSCFRSPTTVCVRLWRDHDEVRWIR